MDRKKHYMQMALALAKRAEGRTSPNPLVGAVLVKNNRVLSRGYHKKAGLPHAEIEALDRAGRRARGATLYVNLEPCAHFGRTPPCVDRIIRDGVKKVIIGMRDPSPLNNGKGIRRLRRHGVDVVTGVLRKESLDLNSIFNLYITRKRPYVAIKVAQSLDGKIATFTGNSRWITNESSRRFVHRLRGRADAVLVGVNTVIKDDPQLNVRIKNSKRQPVRVILDSKLKTPKKSRVLKNRPEGVIIATTRCAPRKKIAEFRKMGIDVVSFKEEKGMVDIRSLLRYLASRGISYLLVEGGGAVISSFLNKDLADEIFIFISPKIIGGRNAVTSVEGEGVRSVKEAFRLKNIELRRFKEDILVQGNVHRDR
jgi:diaminohydroxyphosphoribosylaminopyrimidine deaminase/5-amino-6-(5-phosphoribosylamino)uracil reductase